MIRNLKVLGMALAAVFAFMAVAASGASAVEAHLTIDGLNVGEKGKIHVEQDGDTTTGTQVFTTSFGEIDCQTFTGENTEVEETISTLTLKNITYKGHQFLPNNEKCKISKLNVAAEIKFGECDYLFHAGPWLGTGEATGTATIECVKGVIEIVAPGCTVTVPAQQPAGHIIFHQVNKTPTEADYVTAEATVEKIKYEGHGVLCATGLKEDGTYKGNAIVTGFNAAGVRKDLTVVQKVG